MSAMAVIPKLCSFLCASPKAMSRSKGLGAGTNLPIKFDAASTNMPLGFPAASSMRPPAGDFDAAFIPAISRARLFAQPAWPSTRSSQTGRSLTAASRSCAVGNRPSPHFSWFQPRPIIQPRSGYFAAYALIAACASARLLVEDRSSVRS